MRRELTLLLVVVVLSLYWMVMGVVVADNVTDTRVTIATACPDEYDPACATLYVDGQP